MKAASKDVGISKYKNLAPQKAVSTLPGITWQGSHVFSEQEIEVHSHLYTQEKTLTPLTQETPGSTNTGCGGGGHISGNS